MVMMVLEMMLPTTGSRPARKVISTSVFDSGRCTPNSGSTPSRNTAVNTVLSSEIFIWANTTWRKATARRVVRPTSSCASGPIFGSGSSS